MVSRQHWPYGHGRKWRLASAIAGTHAFVLVLLTFSSISEVHGAEDGRKYAWNEQASAGSRINGISTFTGLVETRAPARGLIEQQEADINTSAKYIRPIAVKGARLDPFNHFHKYRGGYDVESKHYWGSLAFTGIAGYALAVAWLLLGLVLLLSLCCVRCCCRGRSQPIDPAPKPRHVLYWVPKLIVALLSMVAIGSCVVLYVGTREFTVEARKVENAFVNAAGNATGTINAITGAIAEAEQLLEPFSNISTGTSLGTLNATEDKLNREIQNIQHIIHKNTRLLHKIITYLEAVLIVVTTLNLIIIVTVPVFAWLDWKGLFYLLVTIGWILTALTAFLFGLDYAVNNFVADSCDAMNSYRDDPYNTTLDAILPCQDLLSASAALVDVGEGIRDALTKVNGTILQVEGEIGAALPFPALCEPIGPPPSYQYIGTCPNGTISIFDLPQEVEQFRCPSNDTITCLAEGYYITDFEYMELVAFANGSHALLNVYPSIDGLTNCSLVVNTFMQLVDHNCRPAKRAVRLIWAGFLALAISMILLLILWLIVNHLKRKRNMWKVKFPN